MSEQSANWCDPNAAPDSRYGSPGQTRPRAWPDLIPYMCARRWEPWLITGFLQQMLQDHFQTLNIEHEALKDCVWKQELDTGIVIAGYYKWFGELAEKRPAVVIKRNAYQLMPLGISTKAGSAFEGGLTYHSTFWVGSHTLFCLASRLLTADILAAEVQRELTEFSPAMVQPNTLGLFRAGVTEVGEAIELEEARQSYAVPVTFGWCIEHAWQLRNEGPPLRRVHVQSILDM